MEEEDLKILGLDIALYFLALRSISPQFSCLYLELGYVSKEGSVCSCAVFVPGGKPGNICEV